MEEKSTKIEAFKGYYVFNARIASAKILLSLLISGFLFKSKSSEFDFFLLIFATCPTPLGDLVRQNWRVVLSYFLNELGNASWRVVNKVMNVLIEVSGLDAVFAWCK